MDPKNALTIEDGGTEMTGDTGSLQDRFQDRASTLLKEEVSEVTDAGQIALLLSSANSYTNRNFSAHYRKVKVPNKITYLPCGCRRDRPNEGDANGTWTLKKIHGQDAYKHQQCGKTVLVYNRSLGRYEIPHGDESVQLTN